MVSTIVHTVNFPVNVTKDFFYTMMLPEEQRRQYQYLLTQRSGNSILFNKLQNSQTLILALAYTLTHHKQLSLHHTLACLSHIGKQKGGHYEALALTGIDQAATEGQLDELHISTDEMLSGCLLPSVND